MGSVKQLCYEANSQERFQSPSNVAGAASASRRSEAISLRLRRTVCARCTFSLLLLGTLRRHPCSLLPARGYFREIPNRLDRESNIRRIP